MADAPPSVRRYFSPRSRPFSTSVSLWIQIGGLDALYDEGMDFADRMRQYGNAVDPSDVHVELFFNQDIFDVGNNTAGKVA